MNIQSAVRPSVTTTTDARVAYHQAREKFDPSAEDQFEKSESFEKWQLRASFGVGIAAIAGAAVLVARYAPTLDGYGAGFAAVLPGAGVGAAVHYATGKWMDNSLSKTDFLSDRSELVAARDQYREVLLQELNDEEVSSITTARWDNIQQYEDQSSVKPTRTEFDLLTEVDQLEFLTAKRTQDGWQGKLANTQDDPAKFATEFDLVQTHDGLLQTMVAGHGQTSS